MSKHSHSFTDEYDGFVGFGFNRETDENTTDIFNLLTRLLKAHLTEEEYHHLFLKE